jgi:hypothetical protein
MPLISVASGCTKRKRMTRERTRGAISRVVAHRGGFGELPACVRKHYTTTTIAVTSACSAGVFILLCPANTLSEHLLSYHAKVQRKRTIHHSTRSLDRKHRHPIDQATYRDALCQRQFILRSIGLGIELPGSSGCPIRRERYPVCGRTAGWLCRAAPERPTGARCGDWDG